MWLKTTCNSVITSLCVTDMALTTFPSPVANPTGPTKSSQAGKWNSVK